MSIFSRELIDNFMMPHFEVPERTALVCKTFNKAVKHSQQRAQVVVQMQVIAKCAHPTFHSDGLLPLYANGFVFLLHSPDARLALRLLRRLKCIGFIGQMDDLTTPGFCIDRCLVRVSSPFTIPYSSLSGALALGPFRVDTDTVVPRSRAQLKFKGYSFSQCGHSPRGSHDLQTTYNKMIWDSRESLKPKCIDSVPRTLTEEEFVVAQQNFICGYSSDETDLLESDSGDEADLLESDSGDETDLYESGSDNEE